jgi:hypothetical protein
MRVAQHALRRRIVMAESGAPFAHLHVHTEYSMLDGAARLKDMFAEVKNHGMTHVAMTDHGNMYGAAEFHRQAKDAGITPVIGIEAYVAPESRSNTKRILWGQPHQKKDDVSARPSGRGTPTACTFCSASPPAPTPRDGWSSGHGWTRRSSPSTPRG